MPVREGVRRCVRGRLAVSPEKYFKSLKTVPGPRVAQGEKEWPQRERECPCGQPRPLLSGRCDIRTRGAGRDASKGDAITASTVKARVLLLTRFRALVSTTGAHARLGLTSNRNPRLSAGP